MPVGDVNIGKTVVVEIKRAASPGPAAPRDAVAQRALAKTAATLTEVEPVSVHKPDSHGAGVGKARADQSQMRQPVHGGRMHSNDQEIEKTVLIEVSDGVCHPGGVRLVEPLGGDIREMTAPVVPVQVGSAKITHDHQVQATIVIEVHQRCAVSAPPALLPQAGGFGDVAKIAATVVQEEIGRA